MEQIIEMNQHPTGFVQRRVGRNNLDRYKLHYKNKTRHDHFLFVITKPVEINMQKEVES